MTSRPQPPESGPNAGEREDPEDKVTRTNFESLAKGLFGVSREAYARAENCEKAAKSKPKKKQP